MQNITWGIYGPGSIANTFVAAMQMVPAATIKSVAGRTPAKAIDFAQRHGIPKEMYYRDQIVKETSEGEKTFQIEYGDRKEKRRAHLTSDGMLRKPCQMNIPC